MTFHDTLRHSTTFHSLATLVLFPNTLCNEFLQLDDGFCDKNGQIKLTDDPKHYQFYDKSTRDLYTCSNGLVIDLPQISRMGPSTSVSRRRRNRTGIADFEKVDFEYTHVKGGQSRGFCYE
jgi:hypothetical protein